MEHIPLLAPVLQDEERVAIAIYPIGNHRVFSQIGNTVLERGFSEHKSGYRVEVAGSIDGVLEHQDTIDINRVPPLVSSLRDRYNVAPEQQIPYHGIGRFPLEL